ncbi:AAA family ATPase [Variovorax sp. J2P1-59]|uniref:AAA family ATPase n=1 Tax=Variovorax flavidus TaxID=3053501 RepID=UPI0025771621|nr:AAA family ATPase [Variovorax sp. J2P1-59]MDM0076350.1 AAA family ATPase [Variovorax sp. J2P1-59]
MTPDLPAGCVIALLGAQGTGKTELANALAARLSQRDIVATLVADVSHEWQMRERRAPDTAELAAIAREQTRRIASAAEQGVVVADTTALVAAVHHDILLGEDALYANALTAHRGYAITLLMALDLPNVGDDAQRDRVDASLRAALARAGAPYSVIHGRGPDRLAGAWNAINASAEAAGNASGRGSPNAEQRPWFWPCDKCSDPACEHRLFSDLVARRP